MKNYYLTFLLCLFTGNLFEADAQSQFIYVNHAATGMNNGTSWENGYTDLKDALANANAGDEIRVAQGTYLPGITPTATFLIHNNLHLLGGYDADTDSRDPVMYETILSGDLNGDDVENDFDTFRSDNAMTVVKIDASITNATLINGFTIHGGHADGSVSSDGNGGGVFSYGAPVFRNCVFEQNYAGASGGGLYLWGSGSQGAIIDSCRFEKNRADEPFDAGGGLYLNNVIGTGVSVSECQFTENEGGRGGGLASINSNLSVTNSTFIGNTNVRQGGGLWFWAAVPNRALSVDGCTFKGNHSSFGGGLYASLRDDCTATIANSIFEGNVVSPNDLGWGQGGGGVRLGAAPEGSGVSFSIDNCQFKGNASSGNQSALALDVDGQDCTISLTNTSFTENVCTGNYATTGVWTWEFGSANVLIENCSVENNTGANSAGLDIGSGVDAGPATFTVRNCQMLNNQASNYSGGLTIWGNAGSSPDFVVEDCQISGNSAEVGAGGLFIQTNSNNFHATLQRCQIQDNYSPRGSALGANPFDLLGSTLPTGATFSLENSLVSGNTGEGAVMLDSFPGARIINTTIADNAGSGIVLSDRSGLTLQNTILYNPGFTEFTDLTGDGAVTSVGGNLIGDGSLAAHARPSYDQQNAEPFFAGMDDYRLTENSPAVDAGADSGDLSEMDLDGNGRIVHCVDIGAYESDFVVAAMQCIVDSREVVASKLSLSPNPAADFIRIQFSENISGPIALQLYDAQGRLVQQQEITAGQEVNVESLAQGFYLIKGRAGNKVYVGKFVKE